MNNLNIKHIIITRMFFKDEKLLEIYLKVTKNILIPSLKSQINNNFQWATIIKKDHIDFVKKYLDIDFLSFNNDIEFFEYSKNNNINIQTRHDMDDYMSPNYVEKIQEEYDKNIKIFDKFLIQAQPIKLDYHTKEETKMCKYTNTRTSMFLSLCQKDITNSIFDRKHNQMYEITNNIITLSEGYVKWNIHGNNISCRKK